MNQNISIDPLYSLPPTVVDRLRMEEPWKLALCEPIKIPEKGSKIIHISQLIKDLELLGYDMSELIVCLEPESEMSKGDQLKKWSIVLQKHPILGGTATAMWPNGELYAGRLIYDVVKSHCRYMISQEPKKGTEGKIGHSVLITCKGFVRVTVMRSPQARPYLVISTNSLKENRKIPLSARLAGCGSADFQRITSQSPLGDAPLVQYILEVPHLSNIDNSGYGPEPEDGWNQDNWEDAPDGVEFWVYYAELPYLTRDDRAKACISYLASLRDPQARQYNILERMSIIARFAGITLKQAEELIYLGPKDRLELEKLKAETMLPIETTLQKCPVSL